MTRIDKYDPVDGGFRAPLAADFPSADLNKALGVGLDVNGRVVTGAGNTGVLGVLVLTKALKAGDIVDVMTDGELVEVTGLVAGTVYFAATVGGAVSNNNTGTRVGHTVEATRLVVRMGRGGASTFVGEQAAIVSLTDNSGGVANDVVQDVPVTYDEASMANNFADLARKVNQILTALRDANVIAP